MIKKIGITTAFAFLLSLISFSQKADQLIGKWMPSEGKAHIEIYKKNNQYFGKIVWLKEPKNENGQPKKDVNNPDEKKQKQPLIGCELLQGFEFDSDDKIWEDGTIYDPNNGSTYSCKIELTHENEIEVRGYIGTPLFGRTDVWTRVK